MKASSCYGLLAWWWLWNVQEHHDFCYLLIDPCWPLTYTLEMWWPGSLAEGDISPSSGLDPFRHSYSPGQCNCCAITRAQVSQEPYRSVVLLWKVPIHDTNRFHDFIIHHTVWQMSVMLIHLVRQNCLGNQAAETPNLFVQHPNFSCCYDRIVSNILDCGPTSSALLNLWVNGPSNLFRCDP